MQRRHFIALAAAAVREARDIPTERALDVVARKLASVCADFDTSQGFNRAKFLAACGVED